MVFLSTDKKSDDIDLAEMSDSSAAVLRLDNPRSSYRTNACDVWSEEFVERRLLVTWQAILPYFISRIRIISSIDCLIDSFFVCVSSNDLSIQAFFAVGTYYFHPKDIHLRSWLARPENSTDCLQFGRGIGDGIGARAPYPHVKRREKDEIVAFRLLLTSNDAKDG